MLVLSYNDPGPIGHRGLWLDLNTDPPTVKYRDLSNLNWIVLSTGGGGAIALIDLIDVDLTGLADGDMLMWDDGSGTWIPYTPSVPVSSLDDLSDVDLTGLATADVLKYDGASFVPESNLALLAGTMRLIQEIEASSDATVDFTGLGFSDEWKDLEVRIEGLVPATDNVSMNILVSTDGGSTWEVTDYEFIRLSNRRASTSVAVSGGSAQASMAGAIGGIGNATGESWGARIRCTNLRSESLYKILQVEAEGFQSTNDITQWHYVGAWRGTSIVNGLQFILSSGNIASGRFTLWGRYVG